MSFGLNGNAGGPEGGNAALEAMLDQASDPKGWYANMHQGLLALKARLFDVAPGLTVQTSEELGSNYFFTWLRVLTTEDVWEPEPDDGWGVQIASTRQEEVFCVFGSCSVGTEAREATASFQWDEMAPAGERATRKRGTCGSSNPPVPVLDTKIVARTGSFVVFEHNGMNMRGLALWFALYLPQKGNSGTQLMPEFKTRWSLSPTCTSQPWIATASWCVFASSTFAARPGSRTTPHRTQAVYTSKQEKLDCMPQGYVRECGQIRVYDDYVYQAVPPEVKEANTFLWADTFGRKDPASELAFNVATIQKATADMKKLGDLTNSLPIPPLNENGQQAEPEGEAAGELEGPVHMPVNANPDKIREFFKHCAIDGASVVHDWAKEALKLVASFDYKTASLQKYAPTPVVDGTAKNSGASGPPKRKAKADQRDKQERPTTVQEVITKLNAKNTESGDAGRMSFLRLEQALQKYDGEWAAFAPKGSNLLWLQVMDLLAAGPCDQLPAWFATGSSTKKFQSVAKFRSESMRPGPWSWNKKQLKAALANWDRLLDPDKSSDKDSDGTGEDDAEEFVPEHTRGKRSRSGTHAASLNKQDKRGHKSEQQLQIDSQQFSKLQAGLEKLDQKSAAIHTAVKELSAAGPNTAAAGSGEQDSAAGAEKLLVALNALNHLVQEFHQKDDMNSPAIRGMINILRNKFENTEIRDILKKTSIDEYM